MDAPDGESIEKSEAVSRFLFRREVLETGEIRHIALMPHPHRSISITKISSRSQEEIWRVGSLVANARGKRLIGRGDSAASVYMEHFGISLVANPTDIDPLHVSVKGWPEKKEEQMVIAEAIAKKLTLVRIKSLES